MRNSARHAARTLSFALLTLVMGVAGAQAKSDYSGTWKINATKSDFGPMPPPDSLTQTIAHKDPDLKAHVVSTGGPMGDQTYDITYTTDGKECTNSFGGMEFKSVANWDGDDLVVDTKGKFNDTDFTSKDRWKLSSDGKTLTMERHFSSAMGEADMKKYWLPWLVGMPAETSRAICSVIFGGLFERFPRLRWCFAHAGGSFLPTLGRIQHGFDCRPDLVAVDNPNPPRNYLGKFWIDSVTHDPVMLRYVLEMVGDDKVCLGSDYPFPLGDLEIGKFIGEMDLAEETKAKIFYKNTFDWLLLSEK